METPYQLTVIVPHYNSPRTLKRLIESIPYVSGVEIVVVDDNSSEPIDSIASSNPSVRILTLPRNRKGGGAARNFGLENSKSQWVLFADADDFFVDGAFSRIGEYLSSELDVVYFTPTSMKEATGAVGERHQHYRDLLDQYSRTLEKSLLYRYFVPWSKLISRRLIEENSIAFDEVIASNDMNFSLKVAYYGSKYSVDRFPIYCVTESDASLTKRTSLAVLESRFYAAVRYNKFLQAHGQRKYQIGVSLQLYNMRHLGSLKLMKYLAYAIKHGMPLWRGMKPLARQIRRDMNQRYATTQLDTLKP